MGFSPPKESFLESDLPHAFKGRDGTVLRFSEIDSIVRKASYQGKKVDQGLAQITRFDRYRPETVSPEEWRRHLGADTNDLRHHRLTYWLVHRLTQWKGWGIDGRERILLLLAGRTHDWSELIVGDYPYGLKPKDIKQQEAALLKDMLHELLGKHLSEKTIEEVVVVAHDKESGLGRIFNLIENIGHTRTGLRAWIARNRCVSNPLAPKTKRPIPENFRPAFEWMSSAVASRQIPILIEGAKDFPPVAHYLHGIRERLSDLFLNMPPMAFELYGNPETAGQEEAKFLEAKAQWVASGFSSQDSATVAA